MGASNGLNGTARWAEPEPGRPRTRGECRDGVRPCPYIGCRFHLAADVNKAGNLVVQTRRVQPNHKPAWSVQSWWRTVMDEAEAAADAVVAMGETCALDIADRGPVTLEVIGELLGGLSRERVRQIENAAMRRLRMVAPMGIRGT